MADETKDVMDELSAGWNEEMVNAGTDAIKAGKAVMKSTNAFLNRSQKGRKQLNIQLEIVEHDSDPGLVGRKLPMRFGLDAVEDIKRLNSALTNLELEIVRQPQDVLRVVRELDGIMFAATIAENKDPQFPPNVYVNAGARRRDLEDAAKSGGSAPASKGPGEKF